MSDDCVLVVEDEEDIREVIDYNLDREGYDVITCNNGNDVLDKIEENAPDLVLLDLMLPGDDGIEVCREIRNQESYKSLPVIMVTAKDTESEVVLGLGVGADDYITKPFSPRELIARVKAVLRRSVEAPSQNGSGQDAIQRGPLEIRPHRYEALVSGDSIDLTATEFRLLKFLADNPGRVYSRDQLVDQVMGGAVVTPRNIDVHVRSIREKLDEHSDLIQTVRGVGYRFKDLD